MPLDIEKLLRQRQGCNDELHRRHVNPQFAKMLKTIGFDRCYTRALGAYLWDDQGRQYLDFQAGYAVHNIGRNHPAVRQALCDFLKLEYPTLVAFETPLLSGLLAAELKKRIPNGLEHVFFTNSGAEGIEAAIKFAKCATARPGIIHARKSFHGLTAGALAINGDPSFRDGFGPFMPDCHEIPFDDLAALERALSAGDAAAFVVEPIQGKGVNVPSPGYLREAGELCRKHGTLLVVDEIQTGLGRTGRFLAIEHEDGGVDPDMIVLSKALSGGYVPVGAVLTRKNVWDSVFSSMDRAIVHSSTFHQGSLAMVAGLATLQVLDEERLVQNAQRMGDLLVGGLQAMRPRFEFMGPIRGAGKGLMIGIEFNKPKSLRLRTAWTLIHSMHGELFPQSVVMPLMEDHRIITQVAGHHMDVVKLIPPLVINEDDVRWFLTGFEQVMERLHQSTGPVWDVMKRLGKHAISRRPRQTVTA